MLEAMEHDKNISIHALREESDPHACGQDNGFINFYPRSP